MRIEWNNISVPSDLKSKLDELSASFKDFIGSHYDSRPYLVCTSGLNNGLGGAHDRGIALDLAYPTNAYYQQFPAHILLFARHVANNTNYVVSLSQDVRHIHIQKEDSGSLRFAGINTEKYNGSTYDFENINNNAEKLIDIAKYYGWYNIESERLSGDRAVLVAKFLTAGSNNHDLVLIALILLIIALIAGVSK